jgi:nucleoside-diphosphate-sugar epimerase
VHDYGILMHTVFITGASGVLGEAIVERLRMHPEVTHIFALAHQSAVPAGVEPARGDITAETDLGLDARTADKIRSEATIIIHAAADTRFSAPPPEAQQTNLDGTRNLLNFSATCHRQPRVILLSSVYVAGRRIGVVYENELEHGAGFVNAYEESKYQAERHAQRRKDELPLAVVRLSTVIADSDGRVTRLAALHHALRFYYSSLAPMVPGSDESLVDLVALDYAAQAIVRLALDEFVAGRTYQVCGGTDCLTLRVMLDLAFECFLRFRPEWRKRAIAKPAVVPLRTFELFVRSVEEIGDEGLRASVGVLKHFAPQLAYPKLFDDSVLRVALPELKKPVIRALFPKVIRCLIECGWEPTRALEVVCS